MLDLSIKIGYVLDNRKVDKRLKCVLYAELRVHPHALNVKLASTGKVGVPVSMEVPEVDA